MLVGQAAHAVLLWHGVLPDIESVIKRCRGTGGMNQAIQFPDREDGMPNGRRVFLRWLMGCNLPAIMRADLRQRFGGDSPAQWLALFRKSLGSGRRGRTLIREQQEDDQGWVWLS
jgi:hypothetical protein